MNPIFKKIYCLDENIKFPICHACKRELTPFSVLEKEYDELKERFRFLMESAGYVKKNEVSPEKHLIFFCRDCVGEINKII